MVCSDCLNFLKSLCNKAGQKRIKNSFDGLNIVCYFLLLFNEVTPERHLPGLAYAKF